MFTLLAIAGIPLGIFLFISGIKTRKIIDRYEFENMTQGGTVEFSDYDAYRKHDWLQRKAKNFPGLGVAIFGLSVFCLAVYGGKDLL